MGKSCWRVRLAIQQLFPIQIFLPFPIFKLLPSFIFQCYRPQAWQSLLTKCQVLNFRVGRSHEQFCKGLILTGLGFFLLLTMDMQALKLLHEPAKDINSCATNHSPLEHIGPKVG